MKGSHFLSRLLLVSALALAPAAPAVAQSADELARSIQRTADDIALQLRIAPTAAEEELQRQKEQLEILREQAPDQPMLRSLERRLEELEGQVAAARAEQPAVDEDTEQFVPLGAPAEARGRLRDVETLQNRADREMMRGAADSALEYLSEAQAMIDAIEQEFADQLPPGYAPLIVAKERSAALQDQLDAVQED